MPLGPYQLDDFYDEMFDDAAQPRGGAATLAARIDSLGPGELQRRQKAAEAELLHSGVTFTVYGNDAGTERIWPFDLIPRIIDAGEWTQIETGLQQRIEALNLFIDDIYHDKKILRDKVVPEDMLMAGKCYRPQCEGIDPPHGIWCHITGTDLVRSSEDGKYYVLEDNMRCPSGVSYVLANRQLLKETWPRVFSESHVKPVADYPERLRNTLEHLVPSASSHPVAVLLTPGIYNSAYFEHTYLAQQMGIELVEARDLVVHNGDVLMRTTAGFEKVDVIYRRIDDDFLDPLAFREDSMLGVPGLMDAYRNGRVALANAPGTGIADDKVVYAYVPQIIKYYLDQDPILPNVPTYVCWEPSQRQHVLANIDKMVVKAANESGGYGMLIGPSASQTERDQFAELVRTQPRNYIAQPVIGLSRAPVVVDEHLEGRHVDLRPFILYGSSIYVVPGGLTRVALRKGSLIVNSSQGGGSKDTWVLEE